MHIERNTGVRSLTSNADEEKHLIPAVEGALHIHAGRAVYRGREGFVEFMRTWIGSFADWSFRIERLIDAGDDQVVVLAHQTATGKGSGVSVELHLGQVQELEDGRVIRVRNDLEHAEALEAAGLSESDS